MADIINPSFSEKEKRLIYELGGDLGDDARPFRKLGEKIGLSEEEVIEIVSSLAERGLMRRFGATLRHQRSGFSANAMVAWRIEDGRIEEVGRILAEFPQVSHCYERRTAPGWSQNLYTMVHASSNEECQELVDRLAEAAGVHDYKVLFSDQELKKTSMRYFR